MACCFLIYSQKHCRFQSFLHVRACPRTAGALKLGEAGSKEGGTNTQGVLLFELAVDGQDGRVAHKRKRDGW